MIQKTIQDYYEEIYKKYPTVSKNDIKRILQYGWKSLHLHNSYGGDVCINRSGFWFYCGTLMNNSVRYFHYYRKKMIVKLRVMYKRKQIPWDGYYYFALTPKQYEEYLNQKNIKGRPKKKFKFPKNVLYKIYDECNLAQFSNIAIFRIPMTIDVGFTKYKEEFTTDKAELLLVRQPLTLNDILISNYKYQFISDNLNKYKK